MGMKYELASYNRAGLVHTKEVFFDPNVKSHAPRDNDNYLYEMGKGENLDSPEQIEKVKELTGTYTEAKSESRSTSTADPFLPSGS
jgi:hypothetical protein